MNSRSRTAGACRSDVAGAVPASSLPGGTSLHVSVMKIGTGATRYRAKGPRSRTSLPLDETVALGDGVVLDGSWLTGAGTAPITLPPAPCALACAAGIGGEQGDRS